MKPHFLPPARPMYLSSRRPVLEGHFQAPPPPPSEIRLFGLIWATYDTNAPTDFSKLESSGVKPGYNWAVWRTALERRILGRGGDPNIEIEEQAQYIYLHGEVCLDLASMFDVVILGHWWPEQMLEEVHNRSSAPNGTKIVLWGDFESINQKPPFSGNGDAWLTLRQSAILALAANSYGDFSIDKYELDDASAGKVACPHTPSHAGLPPQATVATTHTWDVDIFEATDSGTPNDRVTEGLIEGSWTVQYATRPSMDGFALDNLLENPFKGAATNDYRAGWTDDYRAGWIAFLQTWPNVATRDLWVNGPIGTAVYSDADIGRRYIEHFFRSGTSPKTIEQIELDLVDVQSKNLELVLAMNGTVGQTYVWATTDGGPTPSVHGTWARVVKAIREREIVEKTLVAVCQTLAEGHIFWQQGFRVPT